MKWIGVIVLTIIGILAVIVAVEYLTTPIHSLPSMLGGKTALVNGHHVRGHYHKRGYVAVVVAILAFAGAIYWAIRIRAAGGTGTGSGPAGAGSVKAATTAPAASADALLSNPAPTTSPEATPEK
jgi:hypothetical protein